MWIIVIAGLFCFCVSTYWEQNNYTKKSVSATVIYTKNGIMEFIRTDYYPNGKIKSITEQGLVASCGAPVGTHYFFDKKGNLSKQIVYKYVETDSLENCLDVIQNQFITLFNADKTLKDQYRITTNYE